MRLKRSHSRKSEFISADEARAAVYSDDEQARSRREDLARRVDLMEELRRVRETLGMTQAEVAASMRTTQPAISELESAETDPRLSTVQKYARALNHILAFRLDQLSAPAGATASTASGPLVGLTTVIGTSGPIDGPWTGPSLWRMSVAPLSGYPTPPQDASARIDEFDKASA